MLVGEAEVTISIKDIRNLKGGHLIGCLQDYNFEAQLYALATGSEDAERKILHELLPVSYTHLTLPTNREV